MSAGKRLVDAIPADKMPAAFQAKQVVVKSQGSAGFAHLLGKARDAKRGGKAAWSCQSTGEKVAVALVLNRPEWLASMNYTIVEAIERAGSTWVALMPEVVRQLEQSE